MALTQLIQLSIIPYLNAEQLSETNATTEEYDFPVKVGPKEQVSVKGIVQEAEMTVPYELVYKIGDVERRSQGTWRGVACSSATMEVSPPIPLK